jgi:hypothetical protein
MQLKEPLTVTILVHREPYGGVWYTVKRADGYFGLGETLQEALDSMAHDLPEDE